MSDIASTCGLEMFKSVMRAVGHLENDAVDSVSSYLLGQINDDGGFRGRTTASDLYYTVFGMTSLSAFGVEFSLDRTWNYLQGFGDGVDLDFVHLTCLLRCRAICRLMGGQGKFSSDYDDKNILARIEKFRAGCGGYNHAVACTSRGSIYANFLAYCAYQDCGMDVPDIEGIIRSVDSLKCMRGGYSNEESIESGTTTATAAAVVLLKNAGVKVDNSAIDWMLDRCTERGGFLASENTKVPDLLSTGTALHALRTVGAPLGDKATACKEFIDLLWMEDGGFAGSPVDLTTDCEYTFYALLGLGSLD
ncbi:MAG: prenyltransferase/squalene oxidase repeat-containing protein [Kiritimatiellae bacterium]|nr:prenyltransferase/squalene oxidase repeat-containing protein [Kiritimatiellia bacterium]MDD5520953.1 prenyltransferase/squalene oxidase repeat-containing protein [Kiritimatiellia bacterium]